MTAKRTGPAGARRPGRPKKYGQPARLLAVTLPERAIELLRQVHVDPGWAIVSLAERAASQTSGDRTPAVQLVRVGQGQSLIVVSTAVVTALPEVRTIPLSETQAFLAFQPGRGLADLEILVRDRLERKHLRAADRKVLETLRGQLRRWRTEGRYRFEDRTIILVSDDGRP